MSSYIYDTWGAGSASDIVVGTKRLAGVASGVARRLGLTLLLGPGGGAEY